MKYSTNSQDSPNSAAAVSVAASPWQRLKSKRIAYLTLPLLIMATITEFVILATGWKYQQTVCLPQGMGVTFFGIGPIGATILAVELLKLPLAIWTASRHGWAKVFMLCVGLPLICVLTFQLVKDMAVYEMGVAMTPASQFLEKAMVEETRISQLNGELTAIEKKRIGRETRIAELAEKQSKAKAELEESLKHNDASRLDAINLTDYQKKELSEVESRQATIIKQFNADTEQLNKAIADLRARRETEVARATTWNTEEARIENAYKAKLAEYTNKKTEYEKDKAEYERANFIKRKLMKEPIDPGVPPERETNKVLKPTAIAEIDAQIKAKETELLAVNNKRRDRVAQVDSDARRVREEFDRRSSSKRDESDRKREQLVTALAALAQEEKAQRELIDKEFEGVVQKVDGIRAEIDTARKKAEGYYEAREASIRQTQVHRIATTVEIVRGLIMGERPMSIKATAKERGDILTDQISMVRIWVYPVLAFIVAFLPTLMVEIGFSTVFQPEQQRPPYRLGFFGRRLHSLYTRAGRQKILRAERLAGQVSGQIAARERALEDVKTAADRALAEKEVELQAARDTISAAAAAHRERLQQQTAEHAQQLNRFSQEHAERSKNKEEEWVAKLAAMADTLNRTVLEKDALRDLQKSEIERQIQMRQKAWSDRVTQLRQELDEQRVASENERTALMQEHQAKLLEVSEDCRTQVIEARRQAANGDLAAMEASAKLKNELKEALHARDTAEAQLHQQTEAFALKLSQAKEEGALELEKAARQEKHRAERQQLEFAKTLRQREEDFEHRLKQREQELTLDSDARLVEEQTRLEQDARRREAELERQLEGRAQEVDARWRQELQQREEAAQSKLTQREQQLQAQAEARVTEAQTKAEQELRRQELDFERQVEAQSREAEARLKHELEQKEIVFQAKFKQREQELSVKAEARQTELQTQWASELRVREEEWQRQAESRVRAAETRLGHDSQQKEELYVSKLRQRDQQWQVKLDGLRGELQGQTEEAGRRREAELERQFEARAQEVEARWKQEVQQREEAAQVRLTQREQQLQAQAESRLSEMQTKAEQELRRRESEFERQAEAQAREADARLKQELQQKELTFQLKLKQREQELALKTEACETELQNHFASELRVREEEWQRQAESRVRANETRQGQEAQQKEELFASKLRQRDQQWQAKLDTLRGDLLAQNEENLRRRDAEADARVREVEAEFRKEMQEKDEAAQAKIRQREQDLVAQMTAQTEATLTAAQAQWETESDRKTRAAVEPLKSLLARTEQERDEARESACQALQEAQNLEKKLTEVSSFLNGWKNGNGKKSALTV